jgi:hypothetical protein
MRESSTKLHSPASLNRSNGFFTAILLSLDWVYACRSGAACLKLLGLFFRLHVLGSGTRTTFFLLLALPAVGAIDQKLKSVDEPKQRDNSRKIDPFPQHRSSDQYFPH